MYAYNGGVEAKHGALEELSTGAADLQHFDEKQDPDPHLSENSDQDPNLILKKGTDPHLGNADPPLCRRL